ncbi:MAG: anti-sigma factor [Limisphaerales bacterium]
MIDDRMQEQATLHVLGALDEAEARVFKAAMQADPELKEFVAGLTQATGALAGTVPMAEPPPQLRGKILAQVAPKQKIVSLPERKSNLFAWLPWSLAAGFAILCIILNVQDAQLRKTVGVQAQQINNLNQMAQSLQLATNNLQQTVLALQETNRLANLRIAMLNSLVADAPNTVAVTLWDNHRQDGVFVVQNLKALSADKDYELWVMDENQTPVAAGVFHMDASGSIRLDFKPSRAIKSAGKFCVTEEVKGGVASPTLKNLVLASN